MNAENDILSQSAHTESPAARGSMPRETRAITCPKCNPALDNPDHVTGWPLSLKYLVFGLKCGVCGTELLDLGVALNAKLRDAGERGVEQH
jgi:hypothetical protein